MNHVPWDQSSKNYLSHTDNYFINKLIIFFINIFAGTGPIKIIDFIYKKKTLLGPVPAQESI